MAVAIPLVCIICGDEVGRHLAAAISLGALIIALGLLVDDAMIAVE
jgi:multidrug efflux pump subunit AcrB